MSESNGRRSLRLHLVVVGATVSVACALGLGFCGPVETPQAALDVERAPAPDAPLVFACTWADPVTRAPLNLSFARDCLVACAPEDAVSVEVRLGGQPAVLEGLQGELARTATLAKGQVRLVAPEESGPAFLQATARAGDAAKTIRICLFVPHEASLTHETYGKLTICGEWIGTYRDATKSGVDKVRDHAESYVPPRLFLQITPATQDLLISPTLTLGQLVVPDEKTGERHCQLVPINYRLLAGIESFRQGLQRYGLPSTALHFLSIFRTPIHNHAIGSGTFSRHKYMDAFDFIIDADDDGDMDDLNGDGKVDRSDGLWLVAMIEELQADGTLPVGGIGVYTFTTSDYRATVHLDFRGHRARWAYYHDRRGKRQEFTWQSRRFADQDKAERDKHPERWQAPVLPLPALTPVAAESQ